MSVPRFTIPNILSCTLISRFIIFCFTRNGTSLVRIPLYMKVLYADYDHSYAIIEFIGEWNDAINNDIMLLKRDILELMMDEGINKFILIGENVLNFHSSDDSYYEEWIQEVEDGWIVGVNFQEHVIREFKDNNIDYYINFGGTFDNFPWRTLKPLQFFNKVEELLTKRLN